MTSIPISFVNILDVDEDVKEKIRNWRNDDYVRTKMVSQHSISKAEHHTWLKKLKERNNCRFWVITAGNIPIGAAYINDIDVKSESGEWGYYIGESEYRNRGLGKEILVKFLNMVFEEIQMKTITTYVLSENEKAIHIYNALGFTQLAVNVSQQELLSSRVNKYCHSKEKWDTIKKSFGISHE